MQQPLLLGCVIFLVIVCALCVVVFIAVKINNCTRASESTNLTSSKQNIPSLNEASISSSITLEEQRCNITSGSKGTLDQCTLSIDAEGPPEPRKKAFHLYQYNYLISIVMFRPILIPWPNLTPSQNGPSPT